jgi:hypothetical protein
LHDLRQNQVDLIGRSRLYVPNPLDAHTPTPINLRRNNVMV